MPVNFKEVCFLRISTHLTPFHCQLALSSLQDKVESEISKAQKLILEKDAELQAAEESLSGLVEV